MNALSPGAFPHPPTQKHEKFMEKLGSKNPMNRIGQPEESSGHCLALLGRRQLHHRAKPVRRWWLGHLVKSLGIIGVSEGNGHPFSYSSIVNGYSPEGLAAAGWPGIYEYVRRRHASEFGLGGWTITHAWTQDPDTTKKLCAACNIQHAAGEYRDFLGNIDGVIIARDDYELHLEIARPFLEAGLPVFINKPFSLEIAELRVLRSYLESGQLMSCSGMRYSREMDEPRANLAAYGGMKLIRGAIVLSWEKYGVHLLEAILSVTPAHPVSVRMTPAEHASAIVELDDGALIQIDALGEGPPVFRVELFGVQRTGAFDITDNFSMFRRMFRNLSAPLETAGPQFPRSHGLRSSCAYRRPVFRRQSAAPGLSR